MIAKRLGRNRSTIARRWRYDEEDALAPSMIAKGLGRNRSTIARYLNNKSKGKWKRALRKVVGDRLESLPHSDPIATP